MRSGGRKLLFVALALFLSAVFIEITLQVLSMASEKVYQMLVTPTKLATQSDEALGWRPNPKHPEHDRLGFRNRSVPKEVCLLALGDSQVYGVGVGPDQAWPQVLGKLLGCATYNMGFGGYGPAHNLLLLEEALALQPKRIVQSIYFGNDFFDSYWLIYENKQLERYKSTDAAVLSDLAAVEMRAPLMQVLQENFGLAPTSGGTLQSQIADRVRILGLVRAIRNATRGLANRHGGSQVPVEETPLRKGSTRYDDGQSRTIFTIPRRHVALEPRDPRILEGQRISLAVLEEMRTRAEANGIEFYVVLIPTKESVFGPEVAAAGVEPDPEYPELLADEEALRQSTKRFLEEKRFVFVDAMPAMQGCFADGQQPYPTNDSGHPNAAGQAVIARAVESMILASEAGAP